VNVRVVVATHRNLDDLVMSGHFRQDLYHRVFVFPLRLPALRERPGDIPVLLEHFARQISNQNGWKPKPFDPAAVRLLESYRWPGNVRELRNVVERLLLLADDGVDEGSVRLALPQSMGEKPAATGGTGSLADRVEAFERETLLAELKRHQFRMTEAARALGLERSHLYKKCQQLSIDLQSLKSESGS
jgi:two-component system nitrogen regulation response regulator NtrX